MLWPKLESLGAHPGKGHGELCSFPVTRVGLGVARWINRFFPALPSVHFWVMPDGVVQKFEILGTKIYGQNKCSEERVNIVRHTKSQE